LAVSRSVSRHAGVSGEAGLIMRPRTLLLT
jgi:hypothetical protein